MWVCVRVRMPLCLSMRGDGPTHPSPPLGRRGQELGATWWLRAALQAPSYSPRISRSAPFKTRTRDRAQILLGRLHPLAHRSYVPRQSRRACDRDPVPSLLPLPGGKPLLAGESCRRVHTPTSDGYLTSLNLKLQPLNPKWLQNEAIVASPQNLCEFLCKIKPLNWEGRAWGQAFCSLTW